MIISRPAPPSTGAPEPWPGRLSRPAGEPSWPADPRPIVTAPGLGSAEPAGPWPDLPDDAALWEAPGPERTADRIGRLDAEQRGA